MNARRAAAALMAGVAVVVLLAGCGESKPSKNEDGVAQNTKEGAPFIRTFYAETIDGRTIPCVYGQVGYGAGLSCDWSAPLPASE